MAVDGGTRTVDGSNLMSAGGTWTVGGGTLTVDDVTSMVDGCTLMSTGSTQTVDGDTQAVDGCTLTSTDGTQTVDDDTRTVDDCTLTRADGTLTVGGDTRMVNRAPWWAMASTDLAAPSRAGLSSVITSMTWWRHHSTAITDSAVPMLARLTASSPGQATTSCLLAQDKDLMLNVVRGRVWFNKDHCPPCIFTFFVLYYFLFTQYLYAYHTKWHYHWQRHGQHCLGNAITSITWRQ
jgi:hypothetical protein